MLSGSPQKAVKTTFLCSLFIAESQAYADYSGGASILPKVLPVQALDHAAAYLLALGVIAALSRMITVCQSETSF